MKDLFFFVCFILIFLCAFSITSWSLINSASHIQWTYGDDGQLHNVTLAIDYQHAWSWKLLRDIANYGVWKVFGQVDPIGTDLNSFSYVFHLILCSGKWSVLKHGICFGYYICCCCKYSFAQCTHRFIQVRKKSFNDLLTFSIPVWQFKMFKNNLTICGVINAFQLLVNIAEKRCYHHRLIFFIISS